MHIKLVAMVTLVEVLHLVQVKLSLVVLEFAFLLMIFEVSFIFM